MKKLAILALSALVIVSMSVPVMANDVVVAFDALGTVGQATFAPFSQFSMYIIGQEIGDVTGWEIGMTFPPTLTVLGRVVNNGPGVNPGGDDNYLIGLGACYGAPGEDYLFVTYNCGVFTNPVVDDQTLCLIAPNDGLPPASGFLAYTSCANQIVPMGAGNLDECGNYSAGCAVVNPTVDPCVVATEQASWGAVKAAY
jgi:hypothetical protein